MTAMLHVGMGAAGTAAAASAGVNTSSNDAADETMKKPVDAYVAQLKTGANTQGVGAQVLVISIPATDRSMRQWCVGSQRQLLPAE